MSESSRKTQQYTDDNRLYILYDGRACFGDTSDATVLVSCESDSEARSYRGDYGDMACFSYAKSGKELNDERHEWNYYTSIVAFGGLRRGKTVEMT